MRKMYRMMILCPIVLLIYCNEPHVIKPKIWTPPLVYHFFITHSFSGETNTIVSFEKTHMKKGFYTLLVRLNYIMIISI